MERLEFSAAGHVLARLGEEEDVRKGRRRRGGTEEDKVGRDALGRAALDDADMLGKVADEQPNDNKAAK